MHKAYLIIDNKCRDFILTIHEITSFERSFIYPWPESKLIIRFSFAYIESNFLVIFYLATLT